MPAWDGTFQWQKDQDAAKPPQIPDDKLVERLAREKNLDPSTGLPLERAKSAKAERATLGTFVRPGEICPQDGYGCVRPFDQRNLEATPQFQKGETVPYVLNDPRLIPSLDAVLATRRHRIDGRWALIAYLDEA